MKIGRAVDISLNHRKTDSRFSTFQRDRRVEFSREWNLASEYGVSGESVSEIGILYSLGEILQTSFGFGSYRDSYQSASRWEGGIIHNSKWIPLLEASVTTAIRDVGGAGKLLLIPTTLSKIDSSDSGLSLIHISEPTRPY